MTREVPYIETYRRVRAEVKSDMKQHGPMFRVAYAMAADGHEQDEIARKVALDLLANVAPEIAQDVREGRLRYEIVAQVFATLTREQGWDFPEMSPARKVRFLRWDED